MFACEILDIQIVFLYDYLLDFKIGGCLLDVILNKIKDVQTGQQVWDETRERQAVMSVAAVYATYKLSLPLKSIKRWHKVCQQLILHPDYAEKKCYEISIVEKYFPEKRYIYYSKSFYMTVCNYVNELFGMSVKEVGLIEALYTVKPVFKDHL